ncbi:MAG: hypothetical protein KAU14_07935 [Thermoplasmata archaeon]|nr:hypothetical protein [Thermoplasmata archaeon]
MGTEENIDQKGTEEKKGQKETGSGKKSRGIDETDEWNAADFEYNMILAEDMMPLFRAPLTGQERIDRLKEILDGCPEYYPILFELGKRHIMEGDDGTGRDHLDRGFEVVKEYFPGEDQMEIYENVCDSLEERLRFQMALKYYDQFLKAAENDKNEEDRAKVHDYKSYCYACLGELDKAFECEKRAIELDDSNNKFYCNMGWVEMWRGNPEEAKPYLEKSLELDGKDETAQGNYKLCNQMIRSKDMKSWEDYLLRPVDWDALEKLEEDEDFEKYNVQARQYNHDRMEAFQYHLVWNTDYTPSRRYDILFSLGHIMDFIYKLVPNDYFFFHEVEYVESCFKRIMHKFIFKTGDIDDEIFNDVYTALLEFYSYLEEKKVASGFKELKEEMLDLKPELQEKMHRYNKIRHNDRYPEEAKEEIREELFEGDHEWPFL